MNVIAINSSSNTDSIAASKVIFERIEGRAAVMDNNEVKEMPKVVFTCRDEDLQTVAKKIESDEEQVLVETEGGEEFIV